MLFPFTDIRILHIKSSLALPTLLYCFKNWTFDARNARRITATEMKYKEKNSRV